MKSSRDCLRILIVSLVLTSTSALADAYTLTAADWSRPRSAEMVTGIEPVAAAVREWHAIAKKDSQGNQASLLLRHAAGEEAALWASELRDWLVALGVPTDSIRLELGGVNENEIEIEVRSR